MVVQNQPLVTDAAEPQQHEAHGRQIGRHQKAYRVQIVPGLRQHPQARQEIDQPMAIGFVGGPADGGGGAGNLTDRWPLGVQTIADGHDQMARMQEGIAVERHVLLDGNAGRRHQRVAHRVAARLRRIGLRRQIVQHILRCRPQQEQGRPARAAPGCRNGLETHPGCAPARQMCGDIADVANQRHARSMNETP